MVNDEHEMNSVDVSNGPGLSTINSSQEATMDYTITDYSTAHETDTQVVQI
jgi:hypothetical protein